MATGATEQAILFMSADASQFKRELADAKRVSEEFAASGVKIEQSQEKLTRATRTSAESIDRLEQRLDRVTRLEAARERQLGLVNRALTEGQISSERAAAAISKIEANHAKAIGTVGAFGTALKQVEGVVAGYAGRLGAAGAVLSSLGPAGAVAAAGIAAVTLVIGQGIKVAEEYDRGLARVQAVLVATGNAAGVTTKQIDDLAQELEDTTRATDNAVVDAAAALSTFGSITRDQFTRTIKVAQDMTAVFGGDLRSSVLTLAKVLDDPTQGLDRLRRSGIAFTASQKDEIETLARAGRTLEAQELILKKVEAAFGGAGAAERRGVSGAAKGLKDAYEDLLKEIGRTPAIVNTAVAALDLLAKGMKALQPGDAGDRINQLFDQLESRAGGKNPIGRAAAAGQRQEKLEELRARVGTRVDEFLEQSFAMKGQAVAEQERVADALKLQSDNLDEILNKQKEELRIASILGEAERERAQAAVKAREEIAKAGGFKSFEEVEKSAKEGSEKAKLTLDFANKAAAVAVSITDATRKTALNAQATAQSLQMAAEIAAQIDKDRREAKERSDALLREVDQARGESDKQVISLQAQAEAAQKATAEYDALTDAYRLNMRELDILTRAEQIKQKSAAIGIDQAKELAAREVDAADALKRVGERQQKAIDDLNKQREAMIEPFRNAAQGIQSAFADAFEGIFDGSVNLFSALKRVATRFIAELVTATLFSGAFSSSGGTGSFLAGLTGAGGGGSAANLGAAAALGGAAFALPQLPGSPSFTAGASGSGLANLAGPAFSLSSLLTNGFPFISQAQSAVLLNGLGLGGSSFLSGALTSGINSSPFGLIGSLGAGFLGPRLGVNTSGIGGTLGGGLGTFLGGALGGPLGAIGGGFLGSIGGGFLEDLFGGGGGMSQQEYQDNINFYTKQAQQIKDQQAFAPTLGKYIERGRSLAAGVPDSSVGSALASAASDFENLKARAAELGFQLEGPLTEAFQAVTKSIKDDFIKSVDDAYLAITDPGGTTKRGLDDRAKQLRADAAAAGGGNVERLIAAQQQKAIDDLNSNIGVALGQLTGNMKASFDQLVKSQTERTNQVKSLGADLVAAEQLAAAERIALLRQMTDEQRKILRGQVDSFNQSLIDLATTLNQNTANLTDMSMALRAFSETVDDFLAGLKIGGLSPLSPLEKYLESQKRFEETLKLAQRGDVEALGKLQTDAGSFLQMSQMFNASSEAYATDFARVTGALENLGNSAPAVADKLDATSSSFNSIVAAVTGELSDNTIRQNQADAFISQLDLLRASLVDLVGPTDKTVQVIDTLKSSLTSTAAATEQRIAAEEEAARQRAAASVPQTWVPAPGAGGGGGAGVGSVAPGSPYSQNDANFIGSLFGYGGVTPGMLAPQPDGGYLGAYVDEARRGNYSLITGQFGDRGWDALKNYGFFDDPLKAVNAIVSQQGNVPDAAIGDIAGQVFTQGLQAYNGDAGGVGGSASGKGAPGSAGMSFSDQMSGMLGEAVSGSKTAAIGAMIGAGMLGVAVGRPGMAMLGLDTVFGALETGIQQGIQGAVQSIGQSLAAFGLNTADMTTTPAYSTSAMNFQSLAQAVTANPAIAGQIANAIATEIDNINNAMTMQDLGITSVQEMQSLRSSLGIMSYGLRSLSPQQLADLLSSMGQGMGSAQTMGKDVGITGEHGIGQGTGISGGSETSQGHYATGTWNAPRGWSMVGEHGPEFMYFQGGERIHSSDSSVRMFSEPVLTGIREMSMMICARLDALTEEVRDLREAKQMENALHRELGRKAA